MHQKAVRKKDELPHSSGIFYNALEFRKIGSRERLNRKNQARTFVGLDRDVNWVVLLYLLLSYAHFVLRYILQVCDVGTSPKYGPTPAWLSGIKLLLLVSFGACAVSRRHVQQSETQARSSLLLGIGCLLSLTLCFIKFVYFEAPVELFIGDFWYTWLFAATAAIIPFTCKPIEVAPTLRAFTLISFWLCTGFWIFEVANYNLTGRLPAVSWPDLVRFGGIMDDPNGYTFLLLLLIALTIGFKRRWWTFRALILAVQIPFTKSFTGIAAACVFAAAVVLLSRWRITHRKIAFAIVSLLILAAVYPYTEDLRAESSIYIDKMMSLKQQSMTEHISFLSVPEEITKADFASVLIGGFGAPNENFFWHLQLDEGLLGTTAMVIVLGVYIVAAWRSRQEWSKPLVAWLIVLIPASIGVPLLRVFPINTLWWSIAAMVVCSGRNHWPARVANAREF